MFTVKKIEMINKTFRLPSDLVERLSAVAQEQGVSMNNLVSQCCEYALGQMPEEKTNEGATKAKP
ncbi:toxin-antitoxin system HicB family antitoxin [Selenomonas sp. KH1T6]|uniref:toxin-antitoxin system HicB family antitoxin n=1 Tax=Selenomonas sp. KH1T6 TaxID=3158784 RepID=UPI0008A72A21|nr:CopG-like RHH_1 or ribbon-helix-helix domain-containing protein, RHH_5 [Selenomonas ruminantium]